MGCGFVFGTQQSSWMIPGSRFWKNHMMTRYPHQFVPIDDDFDLGFSLIEEVFGRDFYVEDENGRALTTLRNQRLLGYARQIMGQSDGWPDAQHRDELSRLGQLADIVTPADYRRARDRDVAPIWPLWEFDHAESAGALE
jgi:hypothetical protein